MGLHAELSQSLVTYVRALRDLRSCNRESIWLPKAAREHLPCPGATGLWQKHPQPPFQPPTAGSGQPLVLPGNPPHVPSELRLSLGKGFVRVLSSPPTNISSFSLPSQLMNDHASISLRKTAAIRWKRLLVPGNTPVSLLFLRGTSEHPSKACPLRTECYSLLPPEDSAPRYALLHCVMESPLFSRSPYLHVDSCHCLSALS